MDPERDRGSAAVEFAIVLPVLVALLFGVIQFGWLFFSSTEMAGGARQGARNMTITNNTSKAKTAALDDMPTLGLTAADVTVSVPGGSCDPGESATVTVTYTSPMPQLIPGVPATIVRKSTALCPG